MNYKRNSKYFRPSPNPIVGIILIILAIILFVAKVIVPGVILIVAAVLVLWLQYSGIPKDEEIDQIAQDELSKLREYALNKLGVDEDEISLAPPIMLYGWNFFDRSGNRQITDEKLAKAYDVKRDYKWRSPVLQLYFFGFSENMIHYFRKTISLVSENTMDESDEIFYKDVVSVKTANATWPRWDPKLRKEDPKDPIKYEGFVLTTTGGTNVECSSRDANIAESSVKAMRNLIKQKKLEQ